MKGTQRPQPPARRRRRRVLAVLAGLGFSYVLFQGLFVARLYLDRPQSTTVLHVPGPARAGAGCHTARSKPCAVLFIGNSHTYVNDLPGMFSRLADSAGRVVGTGATTAGGATLSDHQADRETPRALAARTWNVVVLQDQQVMPASGLYRRLEFRPAATKLVASIRHAGAQPMFFETWARRHGWVWSGLFGYGAMQTALADGYDAVGHDLNVEVAPVGDVWRKALSDGDALPALWVPDGSHATPAGTYLAACTAYAQIFGASPVGLSYRARLPKQAATQIQRIAASVVLGRRTSRGV